ncbi:membrane protein insertase YidC [Lacticaseibacillus mingshuiensis]|uniref:Membrane protein insertase YidC n=1 Tax=Lacticaseibacillus mingshuiensis TaxID=2799574 RepID=A0ABW4CIY0_9LACO|nr:membrane protein insertase YidC [Lacticaseibacillus mingshuiensis]
MHKMKRWLTFGGLGSLALFLTACGNQTLQRATQLKAPTSGIYGWMYKVFGLPIAHLMQWLAGIIGGPSAYGIAILVITLVVRLVLLPLMLNQQRKMTISQEKMKVLKPQIDILQAEMKKHQGDQQATLQLNTTMQEVYRKNNTSMIPSMGCLTLLIQLPIFSGLYQAVAYSPEISKSTFFGIPLGHTNIIITIVATLLYLVQSWLMMQSVPAEQRQAMRVSALLSPAMTFFFCLMYNAGLGLYFLAGGVIIVIQQIIVTYIITPNIRKKMDADLVDNPPVIVVDETTFAKPAQPLYETETSTGDHTTGKSRPTGHGRNAGRQNHR